jgi:putative membrane protein
MGYGYDGHGGDGWNWVGMFGMMAFGVAVLVAIVLLVLVLTRRDHHSRPGEPTALEELDRRLARGEIDVDEYKLRREALLAAR